LTWKDQYLKYIQSMHQRKSVFYDNINQLLSTFSQWNTFCKHS